MVKPICRDVLFLQQKSKPATEADRILITDLYETLRAHQDECIGMAANMIGVNKRMIVCHFMFYDEVMINPVITQKEGPYETEESCLSLIGKRKTTRYKKITVEYLNTDFKPAKKTLEGLNAQIVQHECDHLEGIII